MNKKLWENLISLYGLQVLNNLVPIVTLPFLARTLGSAHWGALAFAEAVANYASLIVEYGFGLSATRELGRLRDDPTARATQLASVLGAQLLLAGVALATGVSIVTQVRTLAQYRSLLPWAFLLAVTRSMVPIWYFQGLEQVRVIAAITISTNMVAALGILFLVRSPDQSWLPLALRTAASSASLVAGLMLAYRVTPFLAPRLATSASALRQGFPLFIFRSATSMYTTANVLLLGLMAPPSVVALFAGAEKISRAAIAAVWPDGASADRQPGRGVFSRRPAAVFRCGVPVPFVQSFIGRETSAFSREKIFLAVSSNRSRHLLNRELTVLGFSASAALNSS